MTPWQFAATIKSRDIHIRTWIGHETVEVWADGKFHSWWQRRGQAESAIGALLGISDNDRKTLQEQLRRELADMVYADDIARDEAKH